MTNLKVKTIIQIFAVILILALFFGIYAYKKNSNKEKAEESNQIKNSQSSDESQSKSSAKASPIDSEEPIDYKAVAMEGKPIIVNFGSEGCGPCRAFKPTLEKFNEKYGKDIYIKYLDVWKQPGIEGDFQMRVIPSQVIFTKDGTPYVPSNKLIKEYNFQTIKDSSGNHIYTLHEGPLPEDVLGEIIKEII